MLKYNYSSPPWQPDLASVLLQCLYSFRPQGTLTPLCSLLTGRRSLLQEHSSELITTTKANPPNSNLSLNSSRRGRLRTRADYGATWRPHLLYSWRGWLRTRGLRARGGLCPHLRPQNHHPRHRIARTDTLLRTQTITQKERYIPPFYRFCTISFLTFVSFVTLAFSIHLLLRYLKIRSPT